MEAILTTKEFNEFCAKVDKLETNGYNLSFTVDRTDKGMYNVKLVGEHDIAELDRLS